MQKAVVHIRAVLGRIIFIGLSIQIVLGLFWMCCSLTGVQWFAESTFYARVSETLLCDEYTGILYPFLLMLTGKNYVLVCLLQLAAASFAGFYFLVSAGVRNPSFRIWGSLVLLTWPMAMQCHMAILPNSLTFSCFLLELAFALKLAGKESKCRVWKLLGLHISWFGAALLTPDYLYLGAVPVLVCWIYIAVKYWKTAGRRVWYQLLLTVAFAGLIGSVGDLTTQDGCYGRGIKSVESAMFSRIAWSSLTKYFMDWPEDVQEVAAGDALNETMDNPENMNRLLQPTIEEVLGEKTARARYREISRHVFKNNYYQIVYEMVWDALGNVFPTVAVQELLDGRGYSSYCARNYEIMRQESPVLTNCYVRYTAWWFVIGLVFAAVMQLSGLFIRHKRNLFPAVLCILSAGAMAVWYTLCGAGIWDYKNGLFAGILWIVWMIIAAVKGVEEEL